eukprot:gene17016-17205_t
MATIASVDKVNTRKRNGTKFTGVVHVSQVEIDDQRVEDRRLFHQVIVVVSDGADVPRQLAQATLDIRIDLEPLHGRDARKIHPEPDHQRPYDQR